MVIGSLKISAAMLKDLLPLMPFCVSEPALVCGFKTRDIVCSVADFLIICLFPPVTKWGWGGSCTLESCHPCG